MPKLFDEPKIKAHKPFKICFLSIPLVRSIRYKKKIRKYRIWI